jgi:hypothetical protein
LKNCNEKANQNALGIRERYQCHHWIGNELCHPIICIPLVWHPRKHKGKPTNNHPIFCNLICEKLFFETIVQRYKKLAYVLLFRNRMYIQKLQ